MARHTGIRFICFILYSALLAAMPRLFALFAPFVLLLCWQQCSLTAAWQMLTRLRWLFLSLLLVGVLFPLYGYTWAGLLHSLAFAAERIAVRELGLDVYPNQIEVIASEQMLVA
jgi:hypothetical protein